MQTTFLRTGAGLLLLVAIVLLGSSAWAATWMGPGTAGAKPRVVSVKELPDRAIVEVEIPGAWVEEVKGGGKTYQSVTIPGASTFGKLGEPALPEVGLMAALPEGRVVRVRVLSEEFEDLGKLLVSPVQMKPCRCDHSITPRFVVNEGAYKGSTVLPAAASASLDATGWLRELRMGRVVVRPITYDLSNQMVRLRKRVVLEIDYHAADPSAVPSRAFGGLPWSLHDAVSQAVQINLSTPLRATIPGPDHLLVISPANYIANVQPLIDWRVRTGTRVTIASMADIGSTANQVKAYVQNAYDTWPIRPTNILIVGDEDAVPPLYGPQSYAASDYMLSLLEGGDIYPEVLVGRLSARNASEVDVQVGKTLGYETTPDTGSAAAWYRGGIVISSSLGDGGSNDDVRSNAIHQLLTDWGYSPLPKLYDSMGTNTPANVNTGVNNGLTWISYMGHGSETAWSSTNPEYEAATYVPMQSNGSKLGVIWDVACVNGAFDQNSPVFAEVWQNTSGKGSVGIWAASVNASWDEPAIWSIEITKAFTEQGRYRFGETALAGGLGLVAQLGTGSNVVEEFEKYLLFGDPMLEIRSKEPIVLEANHAPAASINGGTFEVVVTSANAPIEGARVAASSGSEVLAVALTDTTGLATLNLPMLTGLSFNLVVTARDAVPVQHEVLSQPPGCGALVLGSTSLLSCNQQLSITVIDQDLDVSAASDTALVTVAVNGTNHAVTLTETGPTTHTFSGSVTFSSSASGTQIQLNHGDSVMVTYQDAACSGSPVTVSKQLTAQCLPPVISQVAVDQITATSARVTWTTNVPSTSQVDYGTTSALGQTTHANGLVTSHQVTLGGLSNGTQYLFKVTSVDAVNNTATNDNNGALYTFETLACAPQCAGKECGPNGCGGVCGTCGSGQTCDEESKCACPTYSAPGCNGCACEACVCAADSFCCEYSWDSLCAQACQDNCGGCGGTPLDGGIIPLPEPHEPSPEAGPDAEADVSLDVTAEATVDATSNDTASDDVAEDVASSDVASSDVVLDAVSEANLSDGAAGVGGSSGHGGSAGSGGGAGVGGSKPDAASAGKGGSSSHDAATDGGDTVPEDSSSDDGCGCRTASSNSDKAPWAISLLGLIAAAALRRRR